MPLTRQVKRVAFCRIEAFEIWSYNLFVSQFTSLQDSQNVALLINALTSCHTGSIHESGSAVKQMSGEIYSICRLIVQQQSAKNNLHMILQQILLL